ncbi:unnamed protein product [Allacma fusca]|uniref:Piezo-type mechanosensitive ion channel component n=1 Tax=Allacma fusca TaxID=39272 RepID=A0A8J2LAU1_9HEXA|nr:unnamed protein product [Allacma fusca]
MTTSDNLLAAVVLRVVLPLVLTACIVFRPCGLSLLYLLLILYLPLVPIPKSRTFTGGHTGRYLKVALFISFLTVAAQFIFQVVLLSLPPSYGSFLTDCQITEKVLRHLGLVKLNDLQWLQIIRWLGPDAAALIGTIICYMSISNFISVSPQIISSSTDSASSGPNSWNKILNSIGAYIALGFLCITSSLQPSIPSGIYYLVFLGGATWWALSRNIRTRAFARIFSAVAIFVVIHIIALFLYQLELSQELIDPESLPSRLLGLVPLMSVNCTTDPRVVEFNSNLNWISYTQPFALLLLCHLLVYEAKTLLSPEVWNGFSSSRGKKRKYSTGRRNSINETTPLMTFAPPRSRYSSSGRSFSGEGPSGTQISSLDNNVAPHSRGQSITSRESCGAPLSTPQSPVEVHELYEYDGYALLLTGLSSLFDIFAKSSYVATNIIMMAWSITYHSWLTFVLLLWACILWMFPNQRKAMLVSSPGLAIYAELLLLAQYVYSLNLTDDELPVSVSGVDFAEIGLLKNSKNACVTILIKSLYTMMFWITLRQFVMERKERETTIEDAAQESFRIITVSTTTTGDAPVSEVRHSSEDIPTRPGMFIKFGNFVKEIMTKFWIWVVAIMLFVIGLGGEKVVLYRIVYMALFLIFVLTFQLSYGAWRKMMYGFWLTVIIYSMLILVLIYIYQFKNIPGYLTDFGIDKTLQRDIGLESYDTGKLFVRLLTPTFFVIITVVQLHYFHKDFLKLSEMSRRNDPRREISPAISTEEPPALIDEFTFKNLISNVNFYGTKLIRQVSSFYLIASEIGWRFLEIHIMKIVLFSAVMLAINDKCALHFVLFLGIITSVVLTSTAQRLMVHLCSIFISSLLLAKMIYQIDFINHSNWNSNCTIDGENITRNDAEWLGLYKVDTKASGRTSLPDLLKGYIGMVLVLTIQAVIHIRQQYQRYMTRTCEPLLGILFCDIQRCDADKGLLSCLKFLLNYGFYKFGVELTLITMVAVIGTRLDLFSVLYAVWLIPMFFAKRQRLTSMWVPFILFVAILLPIQYLSCVGAPPFLCWEYPWIGWSGERVDLKIWLFLPDIADPPSASRLIPDFFLLLFACQQQIVFRVEKHIQTDDFGGGSNREITEPHVPPFLNPTPDFLTYAKSWLDVLKRCVLLAFFWITLAIIFLTGTNRVNLFALGYLVGSFTFLWEGNEFYLRSRKSIIKRWNYLLAYNVFVIFSKSLLQLVGCVFLQTLQINVCWFVQLFGIACLNKFRTSASKGSVADDKQTACSVPTDEAGLMWDGITFAFLIFQRRIFNSYYFFHIRAETEAQAKLASRGAELIEELMQKQIKQQEEVEKEVLEKIKMKMDRIKATHQGRPKEHQDHFDAIRSGDYYMFDENEDDELEMIDSITEEEDDEDQDRPVGVTLSELMSSALKTDVESATEMARLARRSSEARDRDVGSLTDSTTGATSTAAGRRRSKKRASKRSALSFRSDRRRSTRARGVDPYADLSAPLAVSDGEGGSSAAEAGGGGDGEQPSTSFQDPPAAIESQPGAPPQVPRTTFMRRLLNYLRFTWAFLESIMISATNYLNKFSRDYRHVSKCLAEEKLRLKEQELNQSTHATAPIGLSTDRISFTPRLLPKPIPPVWDPSKDEEVERGLDFTKQLSTEESEIGGSGDAGSKDDLQTVVEKPSPQKEKESEFDSLDKISISEVDEKETSYPIVLLVTALWYVVISHSDVVCYFIVFLNQIKSASVLSLPLPLMVLFWGSLSVPRPTKTFWVTIIAYTEALVVIKYLFQFNFFPWNETKENQVKSSPFWPPRIMGVEQQEKYAVYDVTLLMVVFFHRFMLKSLGLWKNKGTSEDGTVYYSEENPVDVEEVKRMSLIESGEADQQDGSDATGTGGCARVWEQWELQDSLAYGPQVFKLCAKKYLSSIKLFFDQILNLEYKVKVDVYSYMFMCDFFNFLVVIFGFASFGSQSGDVSSYLEENKVPVPFLVMVILQFGLIVVDRALYLRKYIFGKFMFQMFLVTLVHGAMFFVLPGVTERPFNAALPPQMWYMVKCIYLLFSAYQIRSGYPTRILGNFLCKKYNYVNMFLFKGFMAVPFLFELRALMDWIWTDTSMTLSDWLKLEDIFAHIFQLKCQRRVEKEYPQGRGMPKARWTKYAIGGSSLFIIIAIIWFPLVLFALGNTVGISIPPRDVSITLTIGSYQPIFTMSAQNTSLKAFGPRELERMNNIFKDKDGINFLNNYEPEDILMAQLSGSSTSLWGISPPAKEKLIQELESNVSVSVVMSWSISRETENPTVVATATGKYAGRIPPADDNRKKLVAMMNGTAGNDTTAIISGIFPKFLRVVNSGKATPVTKLNKGLSDSLRWNCTKDVKNDLNCGMRSLELKLERNVDTPGSTLEWWTLKEECSEKPLSYLPLGDNCLYLNLYTFNEKAFPPTLSWISGGGIIGLYTTLVLVASKFVRSFFAGISFLIMFDDMPNVDRVFQLCLDIYLVRESGELALEEDLFAKLIFLYRSPETLIKWTRLKRVREPPPPGEGQAENGAPLRAIQQ